MEWKLLENSFWVNLDVLNSVGVNNTFMKGIKQT